MKAILRQGPNRVLMVEKDRPVPADEEVIVKVSFAGICGSDIHRYSEDKPRWDSLILGHEFSGTVWETGSDVDKSLIGQRVSAAPLIPCHSCDACSRGDFSLCRGYSFIGSRTDGCFAEYVRVPVQNLVPLGPDLPLEWGAFIEPISVCLHPILRLKNLLGRTVLVTGLGTIGLLAIQIFKAMGARHVVACDLIAEKLQLARELGASEAVDALSGNLEDVMDGLGGADVVFEASGSNPAKKDAIRVARGGGQILLVGTSPRDISFEAALFEQITRKELTITGSWMNYSPPWPGDEWQTAAWLLEEGLVNVHSLITHRFPLEDFQQALDVLQEEGKSAVKIMIEQGDLT